MVMVMMMIGEKYGDGDNDAMNDSDDGDCNEGDDNGDKEDIA